MGLRELRQAASDLVRRVEAGEEFTITVAGRPSARLVGATARRWQRFEAIEGLFSGPSDTAWAADRDRIDDSVRDPWVDS